MRAAFVNEFGNPDSIQVGDLPDPVPAKGEVLIRVRYAGLNPVDWKICRGALSGGFPHAFPLVPGWDVCGVIESLGEDVSEYAVGEEVLANCFKPTIQEGSFAELVTVPTTSLAKKPENMSSAEAGGFSLAALTAWQGLFESLKIKKDETVLITGGAGGVGHLAIQLGKAHGAKVIATSSTSNLGFLKELGADACVDYTQGDFVSQIRQVCPTGPDHLFNCVSLAALQELAPTVRRGGKICSIAGRLEVQKTEELGVTFETIFVRPDGKQLSHLCQLFRDKEVKIHIQEEFPLNEIAQAFETSMQGRVRGKIVISVQ